MTKNMLRHYFISNSLDDLEVFEEQMEAKGSFDAADPNANAGTRRGR